MFLSDLPLTPLQLANLSAAASTTQIEALGVYGHQASDFYKGKSWPTYRSGLIYPPVNRRSKLNSRAIVQTVHQSTAFTPEHPPWMGTLFTAIEQFQTAEDNDLNPYLISLNSPT